VEMQNSDSEEELSGNEDELSGNEDESEDDFDGYVDEDEVIQNRHMEGNSDVEDDGNDVQNSGRDVEGERSDEAQSSSDEDMDTVPPYALQPGCSVPLPGSGPIDYFSLFVDESMLQHIVEQTTLFSEQFMASHTLARRSRVRQWLKEDHPVAALRQFIALILIMGISPN